MRDDFDDAVQQNDNATLKWSHDSNQGIIYSTETMCACIALLNTEKTFVRYSSVLSSCLKFFFAQQANHANSHKIQVSMFMRLKKVLELVLWPERYAHFIQVTVSEIYSLWDFSKKNSDVCFAHTTKLRPESWSNWVSIVFSLQYTRGLSSSRYLSLVWPV